MDLTNKAYANIRVLRNLQPEETLDGSRFHLEVGDTDNDSEEVLRDVESVLHFTFHQLFFSLRKKSLPPRKVYCMLEESILNIYENEQMQNFMKDKQFSEMVKDIDNKVSLLNEYHWFESPFYPFFEKMYELKERFYKMYSELNIPRSFEEYNKSMYGSFYMSDDDDDDGGDKSEEDKSEEDKSDDEDKSDEDKSDDEDKSEEDKSEEDKSDSDKDTGEENPNLVYDECDVKTSSEEDGEKLEIPADETSKGLWNWN